MAASKKTGRSRKHPPVTYTPRVSSKRRQRVSYSRSQWFVRFPANSERPEAYMTLTDDGTHCYDITKAAFFDSWLDAKLAIQSRYSTPDLFLDSALAGLFVIDDISQYSLDLPPCVRSGGLAEDSRPAAPQAQPDRSQAKRGSKPLSTGAAGGQTAGEAVASSPMPGTLMPGITPTMGVNRDV